MQRLAIFNMKWNKHDRAAYHFPSTIPFTTRDPTVKDRCKNKISRGIECRKFVDYDNALRKSKTISQVEIFYF